jgi:hypothetical protein
MLSIHICLCRKKQKKTYASRVIFHSISVDFGLSFVRNFSIQTFFLFCYYSQNAPDRHQTSMFPLAIAIAAVALGRRLPLFHPRPHRHPHHHLFFFFFSFFFPVVATSTSLHMDAIDAGEAAIKIASVSRDRLGVAAISERRYKSRRIPQTM